MGDNYVTCQTEKGSINIDGKILADIIITVVYGCNIVNVAREVQEKVMSLVQASTGIENAEVNVHVSGIAFDK